MRLLCLLVTTLFLLSFTPLPANSNHPISQTNQNQMLNDLEFINHLFHVSYAPFQWKIDQFQWDLENEINTAKQTILNDPSFSLKRFQNIIKILCQNTKDYHVVPQFYSTARASLPFRMQSAAGRYFISEIDFFETSIFDRFPFSIGDEILTFDGQPIQEIAKKFMKEEIGSNDNGTDQALTEFYLTHRGGIYGHEIPKGKIEITYRKPSSQKLRRTTLKWDYHPELVTSNLAKGLKMPVNHNPLPNLRQNDFLLQKPFMTPRCQRIKSALPHAADSNEPAEMLGAKRGRLPYLGTVLWESGDDIDFHAYLFLMDNAQVGAYIRIPTFYTDDGDASALQFAEIIDLFENASSALVIDQTNNGGGIVLYLYALIAILTDSPLEVPQHRVMLTQEDVYFAAKSHKRLRKITSDRSAKKMLGDTIEGLEVNLKLINCLLSSHQFTLDQWQEGKRFTDPTYMYGIKEIQPHSDIHYTKPILILTNNLDFSAADFFPAIMQDNQRATIMGARTAGAGGYIEKVSFPNLSGIKQLDFTASFSIRPNGMPIENLGVTPDIPYEISPIDLQNDYVEYKQNILQQLNLMISESEK